MNQTQAPSLHFLVSAVYHDNLTCSSGYLPAPLTQTWAPSTNYPGSGSQHPSPRLEFPAPITQVQAPSTPHPGLSSQHPLPRFRLPASLTQTSVPSTPHQVLLVQYDKETCLSVKRITMTVIIKFQNKFLGSKD